MNKLQRDWQQHHLLASLSEDSLSRAIAQHAKIMQTLHDMVTEDYVGSYAGLYLEQDELPQWLLERLADPSFPTSLTPAPAGLSQLDQLMYHFDPEIVKDTPAVSLSHSRFIYTHGLDEEFEDQVKNGDTEADFIDDEAIESDGEDSASGSSESV